MLRTIAGGVVPAVVLVIATACGAGPTPTGSPGGTPTGLPSGTAAPSTTAGVSGSIFVTGSSTIEPVSLAVSEAFKALNPDFGFEVRGPGTGDGFAEFCAGNADVADASRAISDTEVQTCTDNSVNYVELHIGTDPLTVLTHPDTPVDCLTLADLYALFGPESDNVAHWKDPNAVAGAVTDAATLAGELGSTTVYPELPLQITAPGEESGTYDAFIELSHIDDLGVERAIFTEDEDPFLRVPGPNYTASPIDNAIIEGVEAGPGSLGFVGYAFFQGAGSGVKALEIDGGEGCVAPSPETAADGTYPLTRPLFIYPNSDKADSNAALQAWVDFYLSDAGIAKVSEKGYVALPAADLDATRSVWSNR